MRWFIAAVILAQGASRSPLASAETDASIGRFDRVLRELDVALAGPLTPDQRQRAYELKATAASAFDDEGAAVDAFQRLLGVSPGFQLPASASPKLRALFARAIERGPLPRPSPNVPIPAVVPARPAAPDAPLANPVPPLTEREQPEISWNRWRTWSAASAGAGLGALAVGTGFGATSQSARNQLLNAPRDASGAVTGLSRTQALALDSRRVNDAAVANVLWTLGAALVATGGYLWWRSSGP